MGGVTQIPPRQRQHRPPAPDKCRGTLLRRRTRPAHQTARGLAERSRQRAGPRSSLRWMFACVTAAFSTTLPRY